VCVSASRGRSNPPMSHPPGSDACMISRQAQVRRSFVRGFFSKHHTRSKFRVMNPGRGKFTRVVFLCSEVRGSAVYDTFHGVVAGPADVRVRELSYDLCACVSASRDRSNPPMSHPPGSDACMINPARPRYDAHSWVVESSRK
jgi:hypothetical protein